MYVIKHKVQIIPSIKIINRINIWEVHQHKTRRKNFIDIPTYRMSGTQSRFPAMVWKLPVFNHLPGTPWTKGVLPG